MGPLINVFLRVNLDVFRQTSRFKFRPSKQNSFYVFFVFVDSRGGGTPDNVFMRVYFDVFQEKCVLIIAHKKRFRSMFLEFLYIVEGGRTPVKRIPECLF